MSNYPEGFTYNVSKRICVNNNDPSIIVKELCFDNKTKSFIHCDRITITPEIGKGR